MAFLNVFLKTLGFLFGITTFFIIITLMSGLFENDNQKYRVIEGKNNSKNIIAILNLNGPIIENSNHSLINNIVNYINPNDVKDYLSELKLINPNLIIIKINSPGGTVSSSSDLEKIISDYKKLNNAEVYFYTNSVLASGGYWVATSGNKIYANFGSIIGSIGVSGPRWYYYNEPTTISKGFIGSKIETKNGIQIFDQNAGISKDLYNPFRKPTEKELKHLQNIVMDIYEDFLLKVSNSRKIEINTIKNDIGALIYNSKQAKEKFLIDGVLSFDELIVQIISERKFNDYKIIEFDAKENILDKYLVNFFDFKYSVLCNELNSNFVTISPTFFNNC